MTTSQYHRELEKAEKRFNKKYDEEMETINELIGDAYTELEKAMIVYLKSDVLGESMDYNELKAYLWQQIKDLL